MSNTENDRPRVTLFEAVGGVDYFVTMVDHFFASMEGQPIREMYPADATESKRRTALFLAQYWGGPMTYSDERGHPRLRMRHIPFSIGQDERDAWVHHMLVALEATPVPEVIGEAAVAEVHAMQRAYFEQGATAMINREEPASVQVDDVPPEATRR